MRFTRLTSPLLIIWKTDLKEGLITWDTIPLEWFTSRNLKNSGLTVRIKICKIKEEMRKKEK